MAVMKSLKDKITEVSLFILKVQHVKSRFERAKAFEETELILGVAAPGTLEIKLVSILSDLTGFITDIALDKEELIDHSDIYQTHLFKEIVFDPKAWISISVDVEVGVNSKVTVVQTSSVSIFNTLNFTAGDVVEISNAKDPNHNGFHTITNVAATVLTFDANMLGKDSTGDKTMKLTLVQR